jgi:hypothetical protein
MNYGKKKVKTDKWIQTAVKRPGSLTAYAKKVAPGNGIRGAFTKSGTLRVAWLKRIQNDDKSKTRRRQAQFALNVKKIGRKKIKTGAVKRKKVNTKKNKPKKKLNFGKDYPTNKGSFNYTLHQYATNAGTPSHDQLHKISNGGWLM